MRRRSKVIPSLAVASQVAGALVLVALSTGQGPVQAAPTLIDVADGPELRTAVSTLNGATDGDADVITLTSAGPYVLDCGTNENSNNDGDLDYLSDDDLTIVFGGPGRATIEIDQTGGGCTTDRVINHRGAGTLTGDLTTDPGFRADGGGILSDGAGDLNLVNVAIEGNTASVGTPGGGNGGGIAIASGTATITNSVVSNNSAGNGGTPPTGSAGFGGVGGGIYLGTGTTLTLINTDVRANQAGNGGASIDGNGGNGGHGGGIYATGVSTVNITGGNMEARRQRTATLPATVAFRRAGTAEGEEAAAVDFTCPASSRSTAPRLPTTALERQPSAMERTPARAEVAAESSPPEPSRSQEH